MPNLKSGQVAAAQIRQGLTGPLNEGISGQMAKCCVCHVTGFCREIRDFLTWPCSIWPSEVAAEERRI